MGSPRDVFEYLLKHAHRPALVVFDGLDEIFDPARRAEAARQVAAFADVHEPAWVVLTSRVVGSSPGVLTADAARALPAPWSRTAIATVTPDR